MELCQRVFTFQIFIKINIEIASRIARHTSYQINSNAMSSLKVFYQKGILGHLARRMIGLLIPYLLHVGLNQQYV